MAASLCLGGVAALAPQLMCADLQPAAIAAFDQYVRATEDRIDRELKRPGQFLYVEGLADPERKQVLAMLKSGGIFMAKLTTHDPHGPELDVPDAMIHHWLGAVFIPGATLPQTLAAVQDYNHHQDFYKPDVLQSKLLSHEGNDFKVYYRLQKKKIITVILNTDHDVHYFPVDDTHCYSRSYSTRIAEVENAGTPKEHEKPIGHDGGFLWRLDSYWRFEQKDGGVYVECESVSLTRDIPEGLGWLIRPFVTSVPKESLQSTLNSTRLAVQARMRAAETKQ
jgi:hypothetical protein